MTKLDTLNQTDYLFFACLGFKEYYRPIDVAKKSLVVGPFSIEEIENHESVIYATLYDFFMTRDGRWLNYTFGLLQVSELPSDTYLKIINIDCKTIVRKAVKEGLSG
jgi:hypothetical protein